MKIPSDLKLLIVSKKEQEFTYIFSKIIFDLLSESTWWSYAKMDGLEISDLKIISDSISGYVYPSTCHSDSHISLGKCVHLIGWNFDPHDFASHCGQDLYLEAACRLSIPVPISRFNEFVIASMYLYKHCYLDDKFFDLNKLFKCESLLSCCDYLENHIAVILDVMAACVDE